MTNGPFLTEELNDIVYSPTAPTFDSGYPAAITPEASQDASGGGFKPSAIGKVGKTLSGGGSLVSSTSGGFNAINQFGASKLGTGLPGLAGSNTAVTATGFLQGAGIGGTIGQLNLFKGEELGSSIGGTIGGFVGSAFGPVGSIIGGALGSAVGGMFGNSEPPMNASEFVLDFNADGTENFSRQASKTLGTDQANYVQGAYTDYFKELQNTGLSLSNNLGVFGGFNDKYRNGFFIEGTSVDPNARNQYNFDPDDKASELDAYRKATLDSLRGMGQLTEEMEVQINQTTDKLISQSAPGGGTGELRLGAPKPQKRFSEFRKEFEEKQSQGAA